jgi:hypothetical protein
VLHDSSVLMNFLGRRWVDVASDGRQRSLHRAVVAQCCLADDPSWQPTQEVNVSRVAALPQ